MKTYIIALIAMFVLVADASACRRRPASVSLVVPAATAKPQTKTAAPVAKPVAAASAPGCANGSCSSSRSLLRPFRR